jgi:ATP-grasp domain
VPSYHLRACIVDGASTGRLLIEELTRLGVPCAHIATSDTYAGMPAKNLIPTGMAAYYDASGGFGSLVQAMRGWQPDFILPGCEHGVELCDRLNAALDLPYRNDPATTHRRRDKYEMHERLRAVGMAAAAQIKTADIDEFSRWLSGHGTYPVVVKPCNSACSDGVRVCASREDAMRAFRDLHGSFNFLDLRNDELIGQEYLDGVQYYVNTVTWDGTHLVTDIWRHDRRPRAGGAFLFENMVLQPSDGEVEMALTRYTEAALDALGFRFGASHCELMWTATGPVLIEANARLMGASINTAAFEPALGHTQAQVLARTFADPASFAELKRAPYQIRKHLAQAKFIFSKSGRLVKFRREPDIAALPSFHSFVGVPRIGDLVYKTVDTSGRSGFAFFLHEDRETVERDAQTVLGWQREDSCFEIHEQADVLSR